MTENATTTSEPRIFKLGPTGVESMLTSNGITDLSNKTGQVSIQGTEVKPLDSRPQNNNEAKLTSNEEQLANNVEIKPISPV